MSKKIDAALGERPGATRQPAAERIRLEGLALDDMVRRPLGWFKHNPENDTFHELKTAAYWQALERDIREAQEIVSPLIAMPDGLLIEGESRLTIARKLAAEGLLNFDELPVRIIKGELTAEEQRRRLVLGNLSRFEIDPDTRAALYAEIWPDLTQETKPGRPSAESGKSDTVSDFAQAARISKRQAEREQKLIAQAEKERQAEGAVHVKPEHVKKAREKVNAVRRAKTKATDIVTVQMRRGYAEMLLKYLSRPSQASLFPDINLALKKALQ